MQNVTKLRIFVASPGDVRSERDQLKAVVDELNTTVASTNDVVLELVRWETHVSPSMGRPQAVVNQQIGPYDIFVGIMWKRFGTPSGVAESGTEEEFRLAYEGWTRNPQLAVLFYFCQEPFMPAMADLDQISRVLAFKDELASKGLIWTYDAHTAFADTVRPHIAQKIAMFRSQAGAEVAVPQGPALLQRQAWLAQADLGQLSIREHHGASPLSDDDIDLLLKKLPRGWSVTSAPFSTGTRRSLKKNFDEYFYSRILAMVSQIGTLAETLDHHPDILISGHARLTVESWSHTRRDVTIKDFILAHHIERVWATDASTEV